MEECHLDVSTKSTSFDEVPVSHELVELCYKRIPIRTNERPIPFPEANPTFDVSQKLGRMSHDAKTAIYL